MRQSPDLSDRAQMHYAPFKERRNGACGGHVGPVGERITERLKARFHPAALEVSDESHLHAGHVGARPEGETHFRVTIAAEAFRGLSRVAAHRLINEALAEELKGPVHALAIRAKAPDEA